MEYMTMRQFAEEQKVSYEAIRRQVSHFYKELDGHIIRKHQMKLLDEYAVNFLRERRRQSPTIVINQEKDRSLAEMNTQLQSAKDMIVSLQQRIDVLRDVEGEKIRLEVRNEILKEQHAEALAEVERLRAEVEKLRKAKELAQATEKLAKKKMAEEINSYQKGLFGFYRKKR